MPGIPAMRPRIGIRGLISKEDIMGGTGNAALNEKYRKLIGHLEGFGNCAVAFSGGVDSTFLMAAAHEALGDRAAAFTAVSDAIPEREQREAEEFCISHGIRLSVVRANEMESGIYRSNPPDRCYHCKKIIFRKIIDEAAAAGFQTVAEGSNVDDEGDYRPGLKAIQELGVRSPLRETGFTKAEIRSLSKEMGLPTWSKPSYACLATRIPYGEEITPEKLKRIGLAEQFLIDQGFEGMRVRSHGNLARIELPSERVRELADEKIRGKVAAYFRELGFGYVTLDLEGYRTGSLNEGLKTALKESE